MPLIPEEVREKTGLMVVTALGLFLALQYSVVVSDIFEAYLPMGDSLIIQLVYLLLITIIVVYAVIFVERRFGSS